MRIEPRDASGRRLARIEVDERARPARVQVPGVAQDVFLRWEGALDDASSLRRCAVCGCGELYVRKNLPQVTPFVLVLAFAGVAVALLGYSTNPIIYGLLALLLGVDVLTLALSERQLVCYSCGAVYSRLRIARYLRGWDRMVAERVRKEPSDLPAALRATDPAASATTPSPTPSPTLRHAARTEDSTPPAASTDDTRESTP
jgi:hypothetical protein